MPYFKKLTLRLSEREYNHLKKQTDTAGLKIEPFLRKLIMGKEIKPRPPTEYASILRELKAQGNNLNQIAHMVNATHAVGKEQIDDCIRIMGEVWTLVKEKL